MLLVLVTSALFTDCRSGKKKSNPITEEVIATDHFIRVGKSGGFTGVTQIYSLNSTGDVMFFSGLELTKLAKPLAKFLRLIVPCCTNHYESLNCRSTP
jgi:hypothetical protein